MKKIEAIIQPFKLREVMEALEALGVDGLTIVDVRGHGRQRGRIEVFRGNEYDAGLLTKTKIEVVAGDRQAGEIIAAITNAARTGSIGDGKIFVCEVEEAIRIRNGQIGEAAL